MSELILGPNFPYARCAEVDPELFFPAGREGAKQSIRAAKEICATCPHIAECLDYALREPAGADGVWGGTTEAQRRKLRARLGIVRRPRPYHFFYPFEPSHKDTA